MEATSWTSPSDELDSDVEWLFGFPGTCTAQSCCKTRRRSQSSQSCHVKLMSVKLSSCQIWRCMCALSHQTGRYAVKPVGVTTGSRAMSAPSRKRGAAGSGGWDGKKVPRTAPARPSLTEEEIGALGKKLSIVARDAGQTAEAKRLIAEGAPVDWLNGTRSTPLHGASINGRTEMVTLLLANKCDPNATNEWGNTPLMYAARYDKADTVRALVEAGCDIAIRSKANKTAAEQAKESGNPGLADYIANHRFRPTQQFRVQGSALRAMRRDLLETGLLPAGPLSAVIQLATGWDMAKSAQSMRELMRNE